MRLLLPVILTITLALPLVACGGGGGEATPLPARTSPPPPQPALVAEETPAPVATPATAAPTQPSQTGATEVSVVNGDPAGPTGEYKFIMSESNFTVGETVNFTITAETELHNFNVPDLGIDQDLEGGETATVTFTFDKPGTFRFLCIFHEANGMEGTIVVQ